MGYKPKLHTHTHGHTGEKEKRKERRKWDCLTALLGAELKIK